MRPLALATFIVSVVSCVTAAQPLHVHGETWRGPPPSVARWAVPSDTGRYVGYYVGGGNPRPLRADAPGPDDGTWGWDYQGGLFRRNVILGWWHGRRYQGGTGAYKTDGPKLQRPLDH